MNFSKKNVILVLAGVLLLAVEFILNIGGVKVDVLSDVLGYVLILAGVWNLSVRNNIFRKSRSTAVKGFIVAVAVQVVYCINIGEMQANAELFAKGIATIFFIYFTYYFMEAVALEAKMQNKAAVTRSFRIAWSVFGVMIFAAYIVLNFEAITFLAGVAQALVIVCGIYYASMLLQACGHLYMDGIPEHADTTGIGK